jgi:hypothetical protein
MRFHGNDTRIGPIVMGHHGETPNMGTDVDDRPYVVFPQDVNLVLVMKHRICELRTCGLNVEIPTVDLVTSRKRHNNRLIG